MNNIKVYPKMFMWMFVGLLLTFGVGYYISINPNMVFNIFGRGAYLWFAIAEVIAVIFLSARIRKMSYQSAVVGFIIYSILSGITFSTIFLAFNMSSIIFIFFVTALIFMIFSIIGSVTSVDLSKFKTLLFMMLIGIILATIVNIFLNNTTFDLIISIIAIVVFIGYIAYDIQKVKNNVYGIDDDRKLAIMGALELYLDFINLFIHLLQIFGDRN